MTPVLLLELLLLLLTLEDEPLDLMEDDPRETFVGEADRIRPILPWLVVVDEVSEEGSRLVRMERRSPAGCCCW